MADQLPPLASAAELAAITGIPAADLRQLGALRAASSRFRGSTNHSVSRVTETVEFDGDGTSSLNLRAIPIVSVDAVLVDDVALASTDYRVSKRAGYLKLNRGVFPRLLGVIEVTFTHGFDASPPADGADDLSLPGVPGDIQAAVLELAQAIMNVTPGVQSQTVLGDAVTFSAYRGVLGSSQQWVDAVEGYRVASGDQA